MLEIFHSQIAMCKDNFWICIFEKLFVWLDFARCLSPPCLSHFYLCNDYNRSSITACSSVLSYTYISMCKLLSTWTSAGVSWWTFVSTHVCKHSLFLYNFEIAALSWVQFTLGFFAWSFSFVRNMSNISLGNILLNSLHFWSWSLKPYSCCNLRSSGTSLSKFHQGTVACSVKHPWAVYMKMIGNKRLI